MSRRRRLAIFAGLAMAFVLPIPQASHAADAPPDLSDWGLHCWCITARHTPHRIIRADDNGLILGLAVHGISRDELKRRLPNVTESQLALLQAYDLLTKEGDRYTTAFPVFDPKTIGPIRAKLAALAVRTSPSIRRDAELIVDAAKAQNHPESAYAVLFGYALDGILWDELQKREPLPDTTLNLDHPFWRGAFWAISPERTDAPGRNEVPLGSRRLIGVWNDRSVTALNARLDALRAAGPNGINRLPVVNDRPGDTVHDAGARIAGSLVAALLDSDDGRALIAQFPGSLRKSAILALAHEFIWSVNEELVRDGIVKLPAAHVTNQASSAELEALIFVIN